MSSEREIRDYGVLQGDSLQAMYWLPMGAVNSLHFSPNLARNDPNGQSWAPRDTRCHDRVPKSCPPNRNPAESTVGPLFGPRSTLLAQTPNARVPPTVSATALSSVPSGPQSRVSIAALPVAIDPGW